MSAGKPSRIAVLGSISMDLIARAPRLPRPGETVIGSEALAQLPGGKGANQAVACARLGAEVAMIGRVGRDAFGDALLAALAEDGIDTTCVSRDPSAPTGVAMIGVNEVTGENSIIVAPGANTRVTPQDVEAAWIALIQADVLLCSLEVPLPSVEAAAAVADGSETLVIINPAPMPREGLPASLLAKTAILTPNEREAALLQASNSAADLPVVVTTHGAAGAKAAHPQGGQQIHVPALSAGPAVDTIGAGDCYSAALAVALAEGQTLAEAMRFASAAAAISVTRKGAQASMPTRAEVDALLRRDG